MLHLGQQQVVGEVDHVSAIGPEHAVARPTEVHDVRQADGVPVLSVDNAVAFGLPLNDEARN